ncbi:hypothetical protein QN277_019083 [Acacia crassicarpa]|uniref:Retrovirus-related Pol polyprotein from transposon TNT 1-94-like beta-barrel domain-containing protein n=1 Tax=Acacia crassicarpa TaxID=499986 RepID=A0AAE1KIL1_9FABA|nr:hypothetical protein QN277_019083 [Acacia crassicarpa]
MSTASSVVSAVASNGRTYSLFSSSSQTTTIKLDRVNFMVWESIVLPLIEGNRLEGHIDGTSRAPLKVISGEKGEKENPAWSEWFSVDRLLVGWLRNTMSQEIGAQLLHHKTAEDLWNGAKPLTCTSTKARVMVIKSDLHNTRKNSLKMDEYLNKMKNLSDELALAGSPIAMDDLILHTLNGLDADYNAIAVRLLDQPAITWVEVQAALLSFESQLTQKSHFANLSIQPSVNLAQRTTDNSDSVNHRGGRNNYRNSRGRGGRYRGGRRGGGGRPFCINCQRSGHTLATCYYRDESAAFNHSPPQAYYANSNSYSDWYMDSGANYHIIPHSGQFEEMIPTGKSHITTCTGEQRPILGIGTVTIPCKQSKFHLKDVLYVPSATKNLMSVNRLVQDNSVSVNFSNQRCDVKDPVTRRIIM